MRLPILNKLVKKPEQVIAEQQSSASLDIPKSNSYRYPPIDPGFPVVSPLQIVSSQAELIERTRFVLNMPAADFERLCLIPIKNIASFMQLLPYSSDDIYRGEGGLFRLSLDLAFHSAQASDGVTFSGYEAKENRRLMEPRWRYATFLAALCTHLWVTLTEIMVVNKDGKLWVPYLNSLYDWATQNNYDRYYLRWRASEPTLTSAKQSSAALVLNQIVTHECMEYLYQGSPDVVTATLAVITGAARAGDNNTIYNVISRIDDSIKSRDRDGKADYYAPPALGSRLEPHLISAINHLLSIKSFTVNLPDSQVLYDGKAAYVLWPLAAKKILEHLTANGVHGVPQDYATLAKLLLESGLIAAYKDDNGLSSPYWTVRTERYERQAIQLRSPSLIFSSDLPEPIDLIVVEDGRSHSAPPVKTRERMVTALAKQPDLFDPLPSNVQERSENSAPTVLSPCEPPDDLSQPIPTAPYIPNHTAQKIDMSNLDAATRQVLEALRGDIRGGAIADQYLRQNGTLAISTKALAGYGIDEDVLIKDLAGHGWISSDSNHPGRYKVQIEINGKKLRCVIFNDSYSGYFV